MRELKFSFYALMASCLISVCLAQTNSPIRWQAGAPNADQITVNGKTVKTITVDGLTLSVSLGKERLGSDRIYYDKFVVYFYALNLSERRVEISPDIVTVEVAKPKAKPLKRETAAHLASTIRQWAAVAGAVGEFGASMQTTQSTTSGAASGSGGTVTYSEATTSPDVEARRRANDQAMILNGSASRAGADLERIELKVNTLLPGRDAGGMLIFDRDKKCEEAIVRVSVDGKMVEFPFIIQRKK